MTATLIYGEPLAEKIRNAALSELRANARVVSISNSEDDAVQVYRRRQKTLCEKAHIRYDVEPIDSKTDPARVFSLLEKLNADRSVTGISIHMPLPRHLDSLRVIATMQPNKDIEAAHPHNLGLLMHGEHAPSPAAAQAAVELARSVLPSLAGLEAVVVGRSAWVGRPLATILLQPKKNAPTVTVCHTATTDLASKIRRADVLFSAAGRPGLVTREMVKPGATVIDVGINAVDGKIVGDVDEGVKDVAAAMTPVPGGVGPVTLALLLHNIVACAKRAGGLL